MRWHHQLKLERVFLHDQLFSIVYDIIIYFYRSFYLYNVKKKKAKKVSSLKTFVSEVQVENHGWIRPDHNWWSWNGSTPHAPHAPHANRFFKMYLLEKWIVWSSSAALFQFWLTITKLAFSPFDLEETTNYWSLSAWWAYSLVNSRGVS